MGTRIQLRILLSALPLLATAAALPAQENLAPKEGQIFPEIEFPTLDGEDRMSLSAFRGQKILLMQFASW